jgi:hypothetical protein
MVGGTQTYTMMKNLNKYTAVKLASRCRTYLLLLLELLPGEGVGLVEAGQARRVPLWRMK